MFVKGCEFQKVVGVDQKTLRRWADTGKINHMWTPGGIRLYELPDGNQLPKKTKEKVVYARVSSSKQTDDLQRQVDYLKAKHPDHHRVVTDVGSGINWKRKGLLSLLDASNRGDIGEVVVASRDRLCRFAFELLEYVFKQRGVSIVVMDSSDTSPERELSDDLLSIVTIFCCRRNGKRRYSATNAKDQTEPDKDAEAGPQQVRRRR